LKGKYLKRGNKKWQATHITPLRPSTLAAFPPWGNSTGAGCVGLADANIQALSFSASIF
tara:strand:+ start:43138 stop:43314 length:177 start_codon:yes stop_codon:yes gene_type:complete